MKVERIDHVHLAVKDLEKAVKFFSEILGTKFTEPIPVEKYDLKYVISPLGFELIQSTSLEGVISRFIQRRGEGLHAISFKVSNLDEAVAELQANGLRLVGTVELGRLREAQFHPKDVFGLMIELCEYEDVHSLVYPALGE